MIRDIKIIGIGQVVLGFFVFLSLGCTGSAGAALLEAQDDFFVNEQFSGDYDQMVKARVIRALVPYSKTFYFLDGATARGITHDLIREFEKEINNREKPAKKHLKIHVVIIPTARDQLIPRLLAGWGDIAAGNLTITEERKKLVDFSEPVITGINEIVVSGSGLPKLHTLDDLLGQEVYVRKSSSYFEHLTDLNRELRRTGKKEIRIVAVEEHLEDEDLLEMVNAGVLPRVVVDSHKAEFWAKIFPEIRVYEDIRIHSGGRIAWAIRKNCPKLRDRVNAFVKGHKKGTLMGNILFKRYLQNTGYIRKAYQQEDMERFRRAVEFFRKYGKQYRFDWLMLAALAYQESGLDQAKVSRVGAIGVMQVLPTTARDKNVNIPDIRKMENNIHAGTKYLRFMVDRYFADQNMTDADKVLFALASYNAGPARIAKLRQEARADGYDSDIWFDNVEVIAARQIGRETVQYVSNIYKYYIAYRLLADQGRINRPPQAAP